MSDGAARDRRALAALLAAPVVASIAWVTLRAGPTPHTGLANVALCAALLAAAGVFAWRERASACLATLLLAGSAAYLCFLGATALFGIHLLAVLARPFQPGAPTYDFRSYSLLLLGVVGVAAGAMGLRGAAGTVRGERPAMDRSVRAGLWLLALNLPLIPLMDFAIGFSLASAGVLVLLALARRACAVAND